MQLCDHAPIPSTITIEATHDAVEVTLASSCDPRAWPRVAVCRRCGRVIRVHGLLFSWVLTSEEPRSLI